MDSETHREDRVVSRVTSRRIVGSQSIIKLSNGKTLEARRFFPAGKGDRVRTAGKAVEVFLKNEKQWLPVGRAWKMRSTITLGSRKIKVVFKEIETAEELALFEGLRKFHYRGGGGAGRSVPLIATTNVWDLPSVLGFVELSSSMIANTARKRFMQFPYREPDGPAWRNWDHSAARKYSNIICRISRFVIHPEIRGLGIAKSFLEAARNYAAQRWHYGGYRARFLEITADMLKYYKFVDPGFAYMGETEGNERRLSKDMAYLVRKALSDGDEMPQGGGGIMSLQRGYASQLMQYLTRYKKKLPDVIKSLQYDPALLDQTMWEALHRLNRRPKPSYVTGLTHEAKKYVNLERSTIHKATQTRGVPKISAHRDWAFDDIKIQAAATISQSSDARMLQDAFGFVGASVSTEIVRQLSFSISRSAVTLICGASGSGKSLLIKTCGNLLRAVDPTASREDGTSFAIDGQVNASAKVAELPSLPSLKTPLDLKGRAPLERFLDITAKCGLAEPQLFVRPIHSLSSGQRYRLQVALAFLADPDVVLIDNFCEPLDRYTTVAVIRGIKRLAQELDVAVLAATASYDRFSAIPDIDQTILLRRGDRAIIRRKRLK